MAEIADVRLAMANLISAAIHPDGTDKPTIIPGFSAQVAIYQDWIKPDDLNNRIKKGDVLISIVDYGVAKSTTRYPVVETIVTSPSPTMAWQISGPNATLSGSVEAPQNLAIIADGADYEYRVQGGDTLASCCVSLAALVAPFRRVIASGHSIIVPDVKTLVARVGAVGTTIREVGRQILQFMVTVWAPNDALRSAVTNAVRGALDDQRRMAMPDATVASIRSGYEVTVPTPEKLSISRSNVIYPVEFASTVTGIAPDLIVFRTYVQPSDGAGHGSVPVGPQFSYVT